MVRGFTIVSEAGIEDALNVGGQFLSRFTDSAFEVILIGAHHKNVAAKSDLLNKVNLVHWTDLKIDAPYVDKWPFIFSAERVVELLIVHSIARLLESSNEAWYVAAHDADVIGKLLGLHAEADLHIAGQPSLNEANLLNFASKLDCLIATKSAQSTIRKLRELLDLQCGIEQVNFSPKFVDFINRSGAGISLHVSEDGTKIDLPWLSDLWRQSRSGLPIRPALRAIALQELSMGHQSVPDPFTRKSAGEFEAWGREVSPLSLTSLPRFLDAAIQDQPELYREYVDLDPENRGQCRRWWKRNKLFFSPEIDLFRINEVVKRVGRVSIRDAGSNHSGVDLVGYLSSGAGVGQSARLIARALRSADIDVSEVCLPRSRSKRIARENARYTMKHDIALLCIDAFQFVEQRRIIGEKSLRKRYNIAQWYWELEQVPDYYREPLLTIDEFWAPTKFLADAMASVAPASLRITHIPLPIVAPVDVQPIARDAIGIENRFLFYFAFDFLSVVKRKNPQAVVRAFTEAFDELDGAALLIKSVNGVQRVKELDQLREIAGDRRDVKIVDDFLTPGLNRALMATADAYISLHRSEGYGLTLSEAMALGKPVIATAYSGNLDFMNEENSLLIPYTKVQVGDDAEGYPRESYWAEPDHASAVVAMQRLVADKSLASDLGVAARRSIAADFSVPMVAEIMSQRIDQIRQSRS